MADLRKMSGKSSEKDVVVIGEAVATVVGAIRAKSLNEQQLAQILSAAGVAVREIEELAVESGCWDRIRECFRR